MTLTDQRIGRTAFTAAVVATALAPVHALSRFATADGKADLENAAVRAWAEPAADVLDPLLAWGSADTVYTTYGRLWGPLLLTAVLCALAVRRRRTPHGGETWGWRLALTGLVGITVGVTGSYWTPLLDLFFAVTIPFMLLAMVGALTLGISLLRRGFRPRATAVLLVLWLPLFVVLSSVVAMGAAVLPALWAWAAAGWALAAGAYDAEDAPRVPAHA